MLQIGFGMKDRLHICIISELFPTETAPVFTFVEQLVCAMADQEVECTVIAPQSITKALFRKETLTEVKSIRKTDNGNDYFVYRPYSLSFSNLIAGSESINVKFSRFSVERTLLHNNIKPDVFYCHFWHSAAFVIAYARRLDIPLFVASGESKINICNLCSDKTIDSISSFVTGVICVSSKNKRESMMLKLAPEDRMIVLPNAVDSRKFYKVDKNSARERLGFDNTDFIVIFVGGFNHRKGPDRVAEAIKFLNNKKIKSIFVGSGDTEINCSGILFKGQLSHSELVNYLNCADVFVLPTLHEGCCNAIIEAMACGLPVISSDRDFNDDILLPEYSIRTDPESIEDIASAISFLYNHPAERREMADKALKAAKNFGIGERAGKIISFIRSRLH